MWSFKIITNCGKVLLCYNWWEFKTQLEHTTYMADQERLLNAVVLSAVAAHRKGIVMKVGLWLLHFVWAWLCYRRAFPACQYLSLESKTCKISVKQSRSMIALQTWKIIKKLRARIIEKKEEAQKTTIFLDELHKILSEKVISEQDQKTMTFEARGWLWTFKNSWSLDSVDRALTKVNLHKPWAKCRAIFIKLCYSIIKIKYPIH